MDGPFVQSAPYQPFHARVNTPVAFLDRDGVLNLGKAGYVNRPEEIQLLDGAARTVAALRQHGFLICVVTNQSPIARGMWGPERLQELHETLQERMLAEHPGAHIDAFLTCPHRSEDRCNCRKPSPAMLFLGDELLRRQEHLNASLTPQQHDVEDPKVNWWGEKQSAPHPLDLMVGDRTSDMGAGWAFGARLFRVSRTVGLGQVQQRLLDADDPGDGFQP